MRLMALPQTSGWNDPQLLEQTIVGACHAILRLGTVGLTLGSFSISISKTSVLVDHKVQEMQRQERRESVRPYSHEPFETVTISMA